MSLMRSRNDRSTDPDRVSDDSMRVLPGSGIDDSANPLTLAPLSSRGQSMESDQFDAQGLDALGRAATLFEVFLSLRHDLPLRYAHALLLVARHPGQSVLDYAKMAGVSHSVMSRHLLDIGERNRYMGEGLGLVTFRPSRTDLRSHEYYLTPKGRRVAHQVIRQMTMGGKR